MPPFHQIYDTKMYRACIDHYESSVVLEVSNVNITPKVVEHISIMSDTFEKIPGFCPDCGAILPPLKEKGGVTCYACSRAFNKDISEVFGNSIVTYTIHFNSREAKEKESKEEKKTDEDEGPVVERKCPKCGNEKMSYATLQLRSADEGQTVFYTCTKCKFKESENS